jgi:hypothetical protein
LTYVKKQLSGFEIEVPSIFEEELSEDGAYAFTLKDSDSTGIMVGKMDIPEGYTFDSYMNEGAYYWENIGTKTVGNKEFIIYESKTTYGDVGKMAILKIDDASFYYIVLLGGLDVFTGNMFDKVVSSFVIKN